MSKNNIPQLLENKMEIEKDNNVFIDHLQPGISENGPEVFEDNKNQLMKTFED